MTNRITAAALSIAVAFVVAACSGGSSSSSSSSPSPAATAAESAVTAPSATPAAEDDLARSMLLTQADFPAGWIYEAPSAGDDPKQGAPAPLQHCFTDLPGQTGHAIGGAFSDADTAQLSISPTVYVFDNEAHAALGALAITMQAKCVADAVGAGIDVDATFALGATHTEPLAADAFGAAQAVRLVETEVYKDQQPPASDVLVFDIVIVVQGRVAYELDGFHLTTPIDQTLLKSAIDKAKAKIPPG